MTRVFAVLGVRPSFDAACETLSVLPFFVSVCVKGELCHPQSQGHPAAPKWSTGSHYSSPQFFPSESGLSEEQKW